MNAALRSAPARTVFRHHRLVGIGRNQRCASLPWKGSSEASSTALPTHFTNSDALRAATGTDCAQLRRSDAPKHRAGDCGRSRGAATCRRLVMPELAERIAAIQDVGHHSRTPTLYAAARMIVARSTSRAGAVWARASSSSSPPRRGAVPAERFGLVWFTSLEIVLRPAGRPFAG